MDEGMIVNVRMTGSGGQAVVLAHGYGGSQATWDQLLPQLSQTYRLVLFDWNFGGGVGGGGGGGDLSVYSSFGSFADALVALLDRLELKDVVFVGHSMSGMIGCVASVKRPDLFAHLVPLAASPRYMNSDDYEGGFEERDIEKLLSDIRSDFAAWVDGFIRLAIGTDDAAAIEKLGRSFKRMRPEIALELAKTIFLGDMREELDKVEVPSTIIQVSNDFVAPLSVGRYMQSRMKGRASTEIIHCDGHFPQLIAAQKLIEILEGVLASIKEGDDDGIRRVKGCEMHLSVAAAD